MEKGKTIDGLTRAEGERIKSFFSEHQSRERRSISWHMNSVDAKGNYNPNYAYAVTWTPGTLCISGDVGEFIVTHYHAMRTIEHTINWLDGIEFGYLMSKSNAQKVYDEADTFDEIIRIANEGAKDSLRCLRKDLQNYRANCAGGREEWAQAVADWQESQPSDGPQPDLADFMPDEADARKLQITSRYSGHHVPDGWEIWYRIWTEVDGYGDPSAIFKKEGRDYLKEELRSRICDEGSAGQFCQDLGIDDFYGVRKYPWRCHVWHAAIQAWVKLVKPQYAAADPVPA